MKKFFYALTVALIAGTGANAANPEISAKVSRLDSSLAGLGKVESHAAINLSSFKASSITPKHVRRDAPTTADDFVGSYRWVGSNQLNGEVFPNEGVLSISFNPEDESSMIVNFFCGTDYSMYFYDCYVENGRLYIPDQLLFHNDYYDADAWFINETFVYLKEGPEGEGLYYTENPDGFYLQLIEDGGIMAGGFLDQEKWDNYEYTDAELAELICIGSIMMPSHGGYFWSCGDIHGDVMSLFEYNEAEWTYVGDAQFKDAWFPLVWETGVTPDAYDVPLYQNKVDGDRYLLMNPYGVGTPYEELNLEAGKRDGYLIFNISDPDVVVFEPLVYSITPDMQYILGEDVGNISMTCYNAEGYFFYLGDASKDDILSNFINIQDKDVSYFDPNDSEGPFVQIYNASFSWDLSGYTFVDYLSWKDMPTDGWIVLPETYDTGVDAILGETAGTVEYFNLQGVRVANPEKGQIVIVRNGNKATKAIIR